MGLYVVFEGPDGSGKSTMCRAAYNHFRSIIDSANIVYTRHPGATALGQELRNIIKHREDIPIDPISERLLFLTDNTSFCYSELVPAMEQNKLLLADRSNFISDYAYGPPSGADIELIKRFHSLIIKDIPRIDLTIIYDCPWEVAKSRLTGDIVDGEKKECRIEKRGDKFFERVCDTYSLMSDKSLEAYCKKTIHIDATQPLTKVIDDTITAMSDLIAVWRLENIKEQS